MRRLNALFLIILFSELLSAPALAAPLRAYVGTWTPDPFRPITPEDNHGQGIYLVDVNPVDGSLSSPKLVAKTPSATWMVISKDGRYLYATNDVSRFNGQASGSVSAFAINTNTGGITLLNAVSAHGLSPCFISIDPSGKYLLTADYLGGAFVVLPIHKNGSLGNATDIQRPAGPREPGRASDDPSGNFAISDHSMSRAHMIEADPTGKVIVTDDAGLDEIQMWTLDTETGKLSPQLPHVFQTLPGSAPRHFAFAPDGRHFFQAFEQDSMLGSYEFDPKTGVLKLEQRISTLPVGFAGSNLISELLISRDGRSLYVANRTFDSIASFAVDGAGHMRPTGQTPTFGDTPRSLSIEPSGRYLYSLNQRADSITRYRIDPDNGKLSFSGQFLPIGSPASMVFLKQPRTPRVGL
jgi:6-phosphogluconolactonase